LEPSYTCASHRIVVIVSKSSVFFASTPPSRHPQSCTTARTIVVATSSIPGRYAQTFPVLSGLYEE
jgi:hypothetical protein